MEARPNHAPAAHRLGLVLLQHGERQGIDWIERAMEWDYRRVAPGLEMLQFFHRQHGDDEAADAVATRIADHEQLLEKARQERGIAVDPDKLMPHDIDPKLLWSLRNSLALSPRVASAWIARQQVKHQAEEKHYVLILEFHGNLYDTKGEHRARIAMGLQASLPISCTVLISGKVPRKLVNSMRAVSQEPFYVQKA